MLHRLVLRNYIAQSAIEAAERDDFTEVHRVLSMLEHPYDDVTGQVASPEVSAASSSGVTSYL